MISSPAGHTQLRSATYIWKTLLQTSVSIILFCGNVRQWKRLIESLYHPARGATITCQFRQLGSRFNLLSLALILYQIKIWWRWGESHPRAKNPQLAFYYKFIQFLLAKDSVTPPLIFIVQIRNLCIAFGMLVVFIIGRRPPFSRLNQ